MERISDAAMNEEVHEILSFLQQDVATRLPAPDAQSKTRRSPLRKQQEQQPRLPPRRPLRTLHSNRLDHLPPHQDHDKDDDQSLSTCPSLPAKLAARRTWVTRMSQALREWKKKHEQVTEQRLAELKEQLEAKHAQALTEMRVEVQQHYEQAFQSWKQAYLQSLASGVPTAQPKANEGTSRGRANAKANEGRFSSPSTLAQSKLSKQHSSPSYPSQRRRQQWKSPDGKRIIRYENGTCTEKSPDGSSVTRFTNGDVETKGSRPHDSPTKSCYYYGDSGIVRMDQSDGSIIWCFPNGQKEHHRPDGSIEVKEWAASPATMVKNKCNLLYALIECGTNVHDSPRTCHVKEKFPEQPPPLTEGARQLLMACRQPIHVVAIIVVYVPFY